MLRWMLVVIVAISLTACDFDGDDDDDATDDANLAPILIDASPVPGTYVYVAGQRSYLRYRYEDPEGDEVGPVVILRRRTGESSWTEVGEVENGTTFETAEIDVDTEYSARCADAHGALSEQAPIVTYEVVASKPAPHGAG